jgi:hypothetical protein
MILPNPSFHVHHLPKPSPGKGPHLDTMAIVSLTHSIRALRKP